MKKQKAKTGKPLLFGFHAVREAWLNPKRNIHTLYMTAQASAGFDVTLQEAQNLERPSPTIIDKQQLDKILPNGVVHQGLALDCTALAEVFIQDIIIQSKDQPNSIILMLDQVTDPHNVGAILRSACAFNITGVVMQKKHTPDLTGVLAKAACGAIEHIPVAFETNLSRALEQLKDSGYFAYGLDEHGKQEIGNIKPGKSVLVLGAEGPGLRRLIKENCDELVKLPTTGPIKSLNVSNATAVALYALSQS